MVSEKTSTGREIRRKAEDKPEARKTSFRDVCIGNMDRVKSRPEVRNVKAPEETTTADKNDRRQEEETETNGDQELSVSDGGSLTSQQKILEKYRFNTIGYQKTKQRAVVDFSTLSKATLSSQRNRGAIKQMFFSQGVSDKNGAQEGQVDALKKVLNSFKVPDDMRWTWMEEECERTLEPSWTDIVHSHAAMSKIERHQQEALWELLNTELSYINKLTIAKELVIAALTHCHKDGFLQEVSPTKILSNLPSILDAHQLFWHEVMYPMLKEARVSGQPFDPVRLQTGYLQFPERFLSYIDYCCEEDSNVEFTRRQLEINPQFQTYLMWVENHPQCGRMRLGDIQAKPHQRITKYPLLLRAVLKNTLDPNTQNALRLMLKSVKDFLESINMNLQQKEDELALSLIAQKIEGYKIESLNEEIDKHVREICRFDLTRPVRGVGANVIRKQLMEETMKIRGRKDSKELLVLLFTDVLLLTKTQKKSDKLKVVRPPLALERLQCVELGSSLLLVEVGDLGCASTVYFLSTPSSVTSSSWASAINIAKEDLEALRRKEMNKTLKIKALMAGLGKDFTQENDEDTDYIYQLDSDYEDVEMSKLIAIEQRKDQPEDRSSPLNESWDSRNQLDHEYEAHGLIRLDLDPAEEKYFNSNQQWEERRVTWNHTPQAHKSTTLNSINQPDLNNKWQSNGSKPESSGGNSETNGICIQTQSEPKIPVETSTNKQIRKDSLCNPVSEENVLLKTSGRFSGKHRSPRLQQTSEPSESSRTDSRENTLLDSNLMTNQIKTQESHRVLKLGSLKNNSEEFWNETAPHKNQSQAQFNTPKGIPIQGVNTSNAQLSTRHQSSPPSELDPHLNISPIQGLLQRAKEREREGRLGKREGNTKEVVHVYQNSPLSSVSPSPSVSDADRDKSLVPGFMYTQTWREGNVDESEDETKDSVGEGISVDWPGWCFDDKEMFDFETDDWLEEVLSAHKFQRPEPEELERHEEGECSEV